MRATALLAVLALPACLPGGHGELEDVSNLDAHWERVWDHASVRRKLQPAPGLPPGLRELRVLREPQGYGRADTLELQDELCDMMKAPRREAELWWYAEAGAACNRTAELPRVPVQEPALWALAGPAVVTRFGAILAHGQRVVLDPEHHGVCHRMRVSEDLSPRQMAAAGDSNASSGPGWVRELFVLSQPWGHTVFHFLAECLPKIAIALPELQRDLEIHVHVPLSTDAQRNAERVMVEEYLAVLLPEHAQQRLVSGEITATVSTYFVTPTRCAVAQVPLLARLQRHLHIRLPAAVAEDHELQQELLDSPGCIPHLHAPLARTPGGTGGGGGGGGGGVGGGGGDLLQGANPEAKSGGHGAQVCGEAALVLLVRRTGRTRRFAPAFEKVIGELIEGGQHGDSSCQLRLVVYDADAGQTPAAVLTLFAAARAVIAPHGAGLTNLLAARRGLRLLEFHPSQPEHVASGIPGLNLCMLHLARALGFAYTGALMWPVEGQRDEEDTGDGAGTSWAGDIALLRSWILSLQQSVCTV